MKKIFDLQEVTYKNLINILEENSAETLSRIPKNFNNSIFWNLAHSVATQQILCYKLSGLPFAIDENFVETYKKGTFPSDEIVSENQISELKKMLIFSFEKLKEDYHQGIFKNFTTYETSYGFTLQNIEDAILFNSTHLAMHLGTIKALLKA